MNETNFLPENLKTIKQTMNAVAGAGGYIRNDLSYSNFKKVPYLSLLLIYAIKALL